MKYDCDYAEPLILLLQNLHEAVIVKMKFCEWNARMQLHLIQKRIVTQRYQKVLQLLFFNMLISIPLFAFNYSTRPTLGMFTPDCKTHRKNVDTLSVHREIVQIWETVYALSLEEPISSFIIRVNLLLGAEALVQAEAAVFILQFDDSSRTACS